MLASVLAVAVVALIAVSPRVAPSRTLPVYLIHRCPAAATCTAPQIVALMRRETEEIWSHLDVRIVWIDSRVAPEVLRGRALTVFLEEQGAPPRRQKTILATLQPPAGPCEGAVARVWAENVRNQVATVPFNGVQFMFLPKVLKDTIVARGLGRALAHEIGHYLLGAAHSGRGLMRARFMPIELVERLNAGFFGLGARERESLASCRTSPALQTADEHP